MTHHAPGMKKRGVGSLFYSHDMATIAAGRSRIPLWISTSPAAVTAGSLAAVGQGVTS